MRIPEARSLAELGDNSPLTPGSRNITANRLEEDLPPMGLGQSRYMASFDCVDDRFFDEHPRRSDLAE